MTRYLISFNDGDMTFPDEDFPAVRDAVANLRKEGIEKGIWLFATGIPTQTPKTVFNDGTYKEEALVLDSKQMGGFTIIDVPTFEEALDWATRIATCCRCPQKLTVLMNDPDAPKQ